MLKKFWMGIVTILLAIAVTITINYAWYVNGYDVDPLATGSSADTYFYTGTGDYNDPYIITTPRHLYNLAWLQYLGRFNRANESYKQYYFKIGNDDVDVPELNMAGWYLPPIGTTKYPFIGNFNGNGCIIKNLTTTNSFGEFGTRHPEKVVERDAGENQENFENCNTIGFFGVVGLYNQQYVAGNNTTTFTDEQKAVNTVTNFYLQQTKVHTAVSATLLGVVAGYVNSTILDVGVIQAGLDIGSDASYSQGKQFLSEYATVGYAEEAYITAVSKRNTIVYNPTTSSPTKFTYKGLNGDSTGWGGSINMMEIYGRLKTEWNKYVKYNANYSKNGQATFDSNGQTTSAYKPVQYYQNQTIVYDDNDNPIYSQSTNGKDNIISETNFSSEVYTGGDYVYNHTLGTSSSTHVRFYDTSKTITFNGNSLKTSSYSVVIENPNRIGERSGTSYVASTEWRYMCITGYAERTMNNQLTLVENKLRTTEGYKISNNGNYLSLGSYNIGYFNIKNETDSDEATIWIKEGNYIYTWFKPSSSYNPTNASPVYTNGDVYSSIKLYLNNSNGNLRASTNSSEWNTAANKYKNGNYYLSFNNTDWILESSTNSYYITYDGNYLSMNDNGTLNTTGVTNINNATLWTFSNNGANPSGYISAIISGTTYYLRYNSGNLGVTNDTSYRTNWSNNGYGLYYTNNNTNYYIEWNNGWLVTSNINTRQNTYSAYYISNSNNYLSMNSAGDGYTNQSSQSNATKWIFNEAGNIYTIKDGISYYLFDNGRYVGVSTDRSDRTWTLTSNNYLQESSSGHYINRSSTTWWCDGDTQALTLTSTILQVTEFDYDNTPFGNIVNPVGSIITETNNQDISYRSSETLQNQDSPFTTQDTYIPLQANSNGNPTDKNTGYIVGGAQFYDNAYGDIRISAFERSSLTASLTSNQIDKDKVYTINGTNSSSEVLVKNVKSSFSQNGQNFEEIIDNLNETISSTSQPGEQTSGYIYGMHFMNATIRTGFNGHNCTIPYAKVNGDTYLNYQVPIDCIDFTLKEKGNISFVAGAYYNDNDSFFSLYDIFRNKGTAETIDGTIVYTGSTIIQYKEIIRIWSDGEENHSYVYEYNDGSFSKPYYLVDGVKYSLSYSNGEVTETDTLYDESNRISNSKNSGYTNCVFRTMWITNPGNMYTGTHNNPTPNGQAYYFEIPVNDGEFALGSVAGKNGAYLMYLDLQANAQEIYRTKISQKTTVTTDTLKYPNGISVIRSEDFNDANLTLDGSASISAYITTSNKGELSISKTGNDTYAIVGGANKVSISTYVPSNKVLYSSTTAQQYTNADKVIPTSTDPPQSSQDIYHLTYIDYNKAEKDYYVTTIKQVGNVKSYSITNANFETEENSVAIEGNLWNLFDDTGNTVTINSIGNLSASGNTRIVQYEYYSNINNTFDMFVTTNVNQTTFAATPTGNKIYVGPTASTGYTDSIRVSYKDGNYIIYINDDLIAQGDNNSITFGS